MASNKRQRKAGNQARRERTGPAVSRDGDRRRRGGPSADQAARDKEARRTFGADLPPADGPGGN